MTSIDADRFVITTLLDDDPELAFFTWKVNVEDVAARSATLATHGIAEPYPP
jgi:hypothetical protein